MNLRTPLLATIATGAIVFAGALSRDPAIARTARPLPQRRVPTPVVPSAQTWHAARVGPHVLYGKIAAIRGSVLTLLLRNGRPVAVNATAAIAHGDYSAPLFVGKLVSVDGKQVGATFAAAHVFRLSKLTNLPADR